MSNVISFKREEPDKAFEVVDPTQPNKCCRVEVYGDKVEMYAGHYTQAGFFTSGGSIKFSLETVPGLIEALNQINPNNK